MQTSPIGHFNFFSGVEDSQKKEGGDSENNQRQKRSAVLEAEDNHYRQDNHMIRCEQ